MGAQAGSEARPPAILVLSCERSDDCPAGVVSATCLCFEASTYIGCFLRSRHRGLYNQMKSGLIRFSAVDNNRKKKKATVFPVWFCIQINNPLLSLPILFFTLFQLGPKKPSNQSLIWHHSQTRSRWSQSCSKSLPIDKAPIYQSGSSWQGGSHYSAFGLVWRGHNVELGIKKRAVNAGETADRSCQTNEPEGHQIAVHRLCPFS